MARKHTVCGHFGDCLEAYIKTLESHGGKFFDDAPKPIEIVCAARNCTSNKKGRCTRGFDNNNIMSHDSSGRCNDYIDKRELIRKVV
jgi:hypothetical protein